jgi:type I restriction-modification system DNA methylase subunit
LDPDVAAGSLLAREETHVPRPKKPEKKQGNAANIGFEAKLWAAADKMRGHMDAAEYKHVALGLIFLKYISDAFQAKYDALTKEPHADPEDRDEYTAGNIFWVPPDHVAHRGGCDSNFPGPRFGPTADSCSST